MRTIWIGFALVTMTVGVAYAQTAPAMPGMDHHHHDHAEATERLGKVSFPMSCAAGSQAGMERGVALLHSFGYTKAQRQFEAIVALKLSPNRLNGLFSAGKAAEQAGMKDEARCFYKAAAEQTKNAAHSKRPELAYAVKVAGAVTKRAGE
jgi:hypothetical protein